MKVNVNIDSPERIHVPIQGHVYQHIDGGLYLCDWSNRLIELERGSVWADINGFGNTPDEFTDVTHLVQVTSI